MANKRKDSSRTSALRRTSLSTPSTSTGSTSFQTGTPPQSSRPNVAMVTSSSSRFIHDSASQPAAIALPASAPSTVTTTTAGRYDARGAALYICAVVTLYALLVIAFIIVLAAVNRRRRNRKSRDNEGDDDDEYDVGVGRLSRYLASVSKLRELRERGGSGNGQDEPTRTAIASVCGRKKIGDDLYGVGSDWPWCRASSTRRNFSFSSTDADFSNNLYLQTSTRGDGVGLDPYFAGNQLTAMAGVPAGADVCMGARSSCGRHQRGRSMDLHTATSPTVTDSMHHPTADKIASTTANANGRPMKQHRRHHGNRNGDWNATSKQTLLADDVITLIQITPSDCSSCIPVSSDNSFVIPSPSSTKKDHVTMLAVTSSPMQMTSSPHCNDSSASSRCRWSTGCNGDIWILQMVSDSDCSQPQHDEGHLAGAVDHQLVSTNRTAKLQQQDSNERNTPSMHVRDTDDARINVPECKDKKNVSSSPVSNDQRGEGTCNRHKVVRLARRLDDEQDDVDLSDVIDMSVAHILNSCRGEQPSSTSAKIWNQLNSSASSSTSDQPWYSAASIVNGTMSDHLKMLPACYIGGGADNDGSYSSTSRDSNSSLQSPTELQRLIHVTSV